MKRGCSIVWFRQDFRLRDNPALWEAAQKGEVLPVYIFEERTPEAFKIGEASALYLHYALKALSDSLEHKLNIYCGAPEIILPNLIKQYGVTHIFWNTCYEPWMYARDKRLSKKMEELGIACVVFNGSYLWAPEEILKEDGTPYRVFTAYKRKAYVKPPRAPLPKPHTLSLIKDASQSVRLEHLNLLPSHPWGQKIKNMCHIGEDAAQKKLKAFIKNGLKGYKVGRDFPSQNHTSHLSAHLHFGEISPHSVWHAVSMEGKNEDIEHFRSEMVWREFSLYLLVYFPDLPSKPLQKKFKTFPWVAQKRFLSAWQKGETGYPFIDAGMRELWQTGIMHNRVRMCVASFLVKNLMIHWHHGRDWFWNCLVDADLANNSASWQWVSGCGADAAPYFRIFNPITQGEKFDPDGVYTRRFVPELKNLPNDYLFRPWEAPDKILSAAGIRLGENYPHPIIDLAQSRKRALEAYASLRGS
jgi:deoxyribodipyrimidine photo-lyase